MSDVPPPPGDPNRPGDGGQPYPSYPSYPSSSQAPGGPQAGGYGPPPTPEKPQSITYAVYLMLAGAALSLIGLITGLATMSDLKDTIRDSLQNSNPGFTENDLDTAFSIAVTSVVVLGIIGILLWLWMAWKNGQGRGWARVVATVFGGLNILFFLIGLTGAQQTTTSADIINLVSVVIAVIVLVLLWRKESSAYYEGVKASQKMY